MGTHKYAIEFKLAKSVTEELLQLYAHHVTGFNGGTELDSLMGEHLKDMYMRLAALNNKIKRTGILGMNNSEAMAFYMYWNTTDTSGWPLANVLIADMVWKIDKRINKARR